METNILKKVVNKIDLNKEEMNYMFHQIMEGKVSDSILASFLTALQMKGLSTLEITEAAKVLREKSLKIYSNSKLLDIVGTGGDMASTFNISTISAIITSACGAVVSKHGNRSASSKCGSADVLEALGVNLGITNEESEEVLNNTNLCFMFAPVYHSSMRHVAKVRKELKIRTIFNILGPLANPASAKYMLLGVYDESLVPVMANVLKELGVKRAMVVHGKDNLDEVTLTTKTTVSELRNNEITNYIFDPKKYGFEYCEMEELKGGEVEENKEIILSILNGEQSPKRDIAILNSALALYVYRDDLSIEEAIKEVTNVIDSKKAFMQLQKFIEETNKYDSK